MYKGGPSAELQGYISMFRAGQAAGPDRSTLSIEESVAATRASLELMSGGGNIDGVTVTPVDANGASCEWIYAENSDPKRRLLYIHGGAYIAGSLASHKVLTATLAQVTGCTVLAVDYRLAPEHPFPAGLDDCIAAYDFMLTNGPDGALDIDDAIIAGDSAGGNLTLTSLLRLKDEGKALPTCAIGLSPHTDHWHRGDTYIDNADVDVVLGNMIKPMRPILEQAKKTGDYSVHNQALYLQGQDAGQPYVSPINGDLKGLPPVLLQVGTEEVLLDDSLQFAAKARQSGVDVTVEQYDHVFHVWQITGPNMPEAMHAIDRMAYFIETMCNRQLAVKRMESFVDLPVLMAENARTHPDNIALIFGDREVTWSEYDKRLNKMANALISKGIKPGDKVAALSGTSVEYMEIFFGTLRAGACMVPLSSMASADALGMMINDSDSKLLFVSKSYRDLIDPVLDTLDTVKDGGLVAIDFEEDGWMSYGALVDSQSDVNPNVAVDPKLGFNIIYSSGTTGTPKGILHSRNMRYQEYSRSAALGYCKRSVTLMSTPLYSNTTLTAVLPTMTHGGTLVLMPKSDAGEILRLSEKHKVTHAMFVPVQYQRIVDHPDFDKADLTSYRLKLSTSAPLREKLKRRIVENWPGGLLEYYGMTEGGVTCMLMAHLFPEKLHTVGVPVPGCEIKICGEDGQELPRGEVGELVGRSRNMMDGYFKAKGKTDEASYYDADGTRWQRSGDMGRMDEEGFIQLLDRKKDMIISGGFNIYATDLELVLNKHEDVEDVAVIGIPSDEWGETPLALVVRKDGGTASEEDMRLWANEKLGKLQRISSVEFRDDLPRSEIGKVLKRELREPYWAEQDARVN